MKRHILIFWCAFLLSACTAPGQVSVNTPQGRTSNYPPAIEDSAIRRQMAEEAWKKFISDFQLPDVKADLEPLLNTPRTLPMEFAGRINLKIRSTEFNQMEATESLRRFIERAKILFGGDRLLSLKDLSLLSFANDGNFYRAVYQQSSYPFPIVNGYGELRLIISRNKDKDKDATLLQWGSRLIPKLDLPVTAEIEPKSIVEKMVGREFSYANIAGQPMRYKVAQASEVVVKGLVVYPKLEGSRMTIHLAYPIEVGKGMTWTVFMDAVNGQELGVKQNFAT